MTKLQLSNIPGIHSFHGLDLDGAVVLCFTLHFFPRKAQKWNSLSADGRGQSLVPMYWVAASPAQKKGSSSAGLLLDFAGAQIAELFCNLRHLTEETEGIIA